MHNPRSSLQYLQRKLFWTLSGDTTRAPGMRRVVIAARSEVGISLLLLVLVVVLLFVVVVIVVVVSASRGAHVLRQDRSNNLHQVTRL